MCIRLYLCNTSHTYVICDSISVFFMYTQYVCHSDYECSIQYNGFTIICSYQLLLKKFRLGKGGFFSYLGRKIPKHVSEHAIYIRWNRSSSSERYLIDNC